MTLIWFSRIHTHTFFPNRYRAAHKMLISWACARSNTAHEIHERPARLLSSNLADKLPRAALNAPQRARESKEIEREMCASRATSAEEENEEEERPAARWRWPVNYTFLPGKHSYSSSPSLVTCRNLQRRLSRLTMECVWVHGSVCIRLGVWSIVMTAWWCIGSSVNGCGIERNRVQPGVSITKLMWNLKKRICRTLYEIHIKKLLAVTRESVDKLCVSCWRWQRTTFVDYIVETGRFVHFYIKWYRGEGEKRAVF